MHYTNIGSVGKVGPVVVELMRLMLGMGWGSILGVFFSVKYFNLGLAILFISVIMMKIFQYFAGNLMGQNSKPAMDLSGLQKMAQNTNIMDDNLTNNDVTDIFNKVKGKAE